MPKIAISQLFVYPVKGARGIACTEASVTDRGFAHDRRFMVVDDQGHMFTQRNCPALTQLVPSLEGTGLSLAFQGQNVELPAQPCQGPTRRVRVWRDEVEALDLGATARTFLSDALGRAASLVYMPEETRRQVNPSYASERDLVGFADGYPYLLANESSLASLNTSLAAPVGMERFRPNIVIAGAPAYAEDAFHALRIGEVAFEAVKLCERCVVINTDQATGVREKGVLEALTQTHLVDRRAMFGQNLVARGTGTLRIGDQLTQPPSH